MPRARLSAYKSSITNRGPQSGGSVGGNDTAGLVNMWNFVGVTQSTVASRLPRACCLKLEFTTPSSSSASTSTPSATYSGTTTGQVVF